MDYCSLLYASVDSHCWKIVKNVSIKLTADSCKINVKEIVEIHNMDVNKQLRFIQNVQTNS